MFQPYNVNEPCVSNRGRPQIKILQGCQLGQMLQPVVGDSSRMKTLETGPVLQLRKPTVGNTHGKKQSLQRTELVKVDEAGIGDPRVAKIEVHQCREG